MMTPQAISREPLERALNHGALFEEGLEYVRQLCGRVWTDHNVHDPGITTLELLCYALTDVANRATLPVEDLLASSVGAGAPHALHGPTEALINAPLTEADYRRLLVDVVGVKNAWLRPWTRPLYADAVDGVLRAQPTHAEGEQPVKLQGLYQVLLDFEDDITVAPGDSPAEQLEKREGQAAAKERALAALHANRNLCQDFVGVEGVDTQPFNLCCELDLSPDADVSQVRAELLHAVEVHLAPPLRRSTLADMLTRPRPDGGRRTLAEVLTGPLPERGFVADEDLAAGALRAEVRLSDLIRVIQSHAKVLGVRDIRFNPTAATSPPSDRWLIPVQEGRKPVLDHQRSRMVLRKRGMALSFDVDRVNEALQHLRVAAQVQSIGVGDLRAPSGQALPVADYESVANHLPEVYGVGRGGLPAGSDERRRQLARQLQGYLLHFDQVMADYLAHLHHVAQLFSLSPELRRTTFHQTVDALVGHAELYAPEGWRPTDLSADVAAEDARRARFLDHLIARFAEQFHAYASIMRSAFGADGAAENEARCALLTALPALGARRAIGWNRALIEPSAIWNSENISGVERRVAHLLAIPDPRRRDLSDLDVELYPEADLTPGDEHRFRVIRRETGKILLSSSRHYATEGAAIEELRQAIARAKLPAGYQRRVTLGGRHYFNIAAESGEVLARRIEYFNTEAQLEEAITETRKVITGQFSGEGMYLIEAIMLRPELVGLTLDQRADLQALGAHQRVIQGPFHKICAAPGCEGCADLDPYSDRVHVILPAYAGRFQNMELRGFVEQTLRDELPAHVLPRICWVSAEDMRTIEGAYRAWLELLAAPGAEGWGETLQALLDALTMAKNVYPPTALHGCDSDEERPSFVLGRNTLGTHRTSEPGE